MSHPRYGANGVGYNNGTNNNSNNMNQRSNGSPSVYIPPEAFAALSRHLLPEVPPPITSSASPFLRQSPMFPGASQAFPPSRALAQQDLTNALLRTSVLSAPPPQGSMHLLAPPMPNRGSVAPPWNPAVGGDQQRRHSLGGVTSSGSRMPPHQPTHHQRQFHHQQQTWDRGSLKATLPHQAPVIRSNQEQPLDLTKKVAPTPPPLPPPPVQVPSLPVEVEAPLDFSTKPRNKPPTSAPSSSGIRVPAEQRHFTSNHNSSLLSIDRPISSQPQNKSQQDATFMSQRQPYFAHGKAQLSVPPAGLPSSLVVDKEISTNSNNLALSVPPTRSETPKKSTDVKTAEHVSVIQSTKPPVPCHADTQPAPLLPAVTSPFAWFTYSSESRCQIVPEEAFQHITDMLMPIIQVNSVFDFVYNLTTQYWPCVVCASSRSTIQIRYVGAEPGHKRPGGRFWIEAGDPRMKPRGWGQKHKLTMKLPASFELIQGFTARDVVQMTLDLQPLSNVLIQHAATCCADLFAPGRLLEIQDPCDARVYWFARVIRNHCGRLCLHYVTAPEHDNAPALSASPHLRAFNPQPPPIWIFASSRRLKPVGWARDNDCIYKAPSGIHIVGSPFVISRSVLECTQLRVNQLAFAPHFRKIAVKHNYYSGDKVDWLHPSRQFFCSAVVRRIVDGEHFVISSFNGNTQTTGYVSTVSDGECFPSGWATHNNLAFRDDLGHMSQNLLTIKINSTDQELSEMNSPFQPGRKLEVVIPNSSELITVATVLRLVDDKIVVLEVDANKTQYIFPISSPDLLPVGFAEMAKCSMTLLPSLSPKKKQIAIVQPEVVGHSSLAKFGNGDPRDSNGRRAFTVLSSPPHDAPMSSPSEQAVLVFSPKCFCGKLFSKSKVALLPTKIGPGDVLAILKEALVYLLNTAYRPSQVLKILHVKTAKFCKHGSAEYSAQQLKARVGSKMFKATTVLCTTRANLPGYLRKIAHTLGFCPGMLYANYPGDEAKSIERPQCTAMCRKTESKPITTRRSAAAAAASQTAPSEAAGRSKSPKMLSVVVPSILAPDARRSGGLPTNDSSGGPSSGATTESRSPRSVSPASMEQLVGNLPLSTNPLRWTVEDVTRFMQYHECGDVSQPLADQEIDGPSLLLLNLAVIQDYLPLRMGPTLKLCRLLERLHIAFRQQLDLARDYFLTSTSNGTLLIPHEADLFGLQGMNGVASTSHLNNEQADGMEV